MSMVSIASIANTTTVSILSLVSTRMHLGGEVEWCRVAVEQ